MRARDEELHHIDSPLAALRDRIIAPDALAEGPVRFLLISGARDDMSWGLVGAFWLSIDGTRGGFLVSPEAIWHLWVEDFMAIVTMDAHGQSLHANVLEESRKKLEAMRA